MIRDKITAPLNNKRKKRVLLFNSGNWILPLNNTAPNSLRIHKKPKYIEIGNPDPPASLPILIMDVAVKGAKNIVK